jgi:hypothetical protein
MAQEKRTFVGGMDFDTENRYVKQGDYRIATNMKPSGENDAVGVLENIVGSEFIDHTNDIQWSGTTLQKNGTFSFPAAGAKVIGKYRDEVHDRVIYFVKEDSSGNGSILEYSQKQNAISVIVDSFAFSFGHYDLITGVNIVAHNEPWAPDGLLYFTDNKNEPRKINISKAKLISGVSSANIVSGKYYSAYHEYGIDTTIESSTGYGTLTHQILKAVKYPPVSPPETILGTDASFKTNNIINSQWQFKYRYVYDDKEKSAWSPISKTKTTSVGTNANNVDTLESDNYIELEFNSGTKEVRYIELAARKVNNKSDFFSIDTIETYFFGTTPASGNTYVHSSSSNSGVASGTSVTTVNTSFFYRFYNNKTYSTLDLKESVKPFDDVPLKAKSQEIIDGNRLVYGNVLNGRNGTETNCDLDVFYKAAPQLSPSLFSIETNVSSNYGTGGGGDTRRYWEFTIDFDLSAAVTGGQLTQTIDMSILLQGFGVYAGISCDNNSFYNKHVGGAANVSVAEYINGIPPQSSTDFYSFVKSRLELSYPTIGTILQNFDTTGNNMGANPMGYGPGHATGNSWVPGNGGGWQGVFNNNLWDTYANGVRLRFTFIHKDTVPSPGVCDHEYTGKIGFEWDGSLPSLSSNGNAASSIPGYQLGNELDNLAYGGGVDSGEEAADCYNNYPNTYYAIASEYYAIPSQAAEQMGFKSNAYHSFGIVYYDDANRSSSVQPIYEDKFVLSNYDRSLINNTDSFILGNAQIKIEVKNEAPSWATGWQIVYSGNRNIQDCWRFRVESVSVDTNGVFYVKLNPIGDSVSKLGYISKPYDWADGDRILIIRDNGFPGSITSYDSINNYKLSGVYPDGTSPLELVIDSAINALNINGTLDFLEGSLVEVFRPKKDVDDEDIFYYEIGERHPVVFDSGSSEYRHHVSNTNSYVNLFNSAGTASQTVTNANQTAIDTAGSGAVVFLDRGDVYHRTRFTYSFSNLDFIEDFHASDYFESDNWDAGRPNVINPQYGETRRPSTIFYSEPLIPNTNINGLSSIFPDDFFEEFDKSYGSIQKLHSRENQLIIFQEDKVSRAQVNRDIITTGSGDQILTAQGAIISQAIPYAGEYGICEQPESFSEYAEVLYFADIKRGAVCRLSQNGITPISEYQMKNYFTDFFRILSRKNLNDSIGRRPTLYGCFNPKDKEYMLNLDLQDWNTIFNHGATSTELDKETGESSFFDNFDIRNTFSSNTQGKSILALQKKSLAKQTIVFSELSNRWTYFMDVYGMCEYINNEVLNFAPSMTSSTTAGSVGGSHNGSLLYVLRREEFDSSSFSINNYGEFYSQETGGTQLNSRNIVKNQAVFVSNAEPSLNKVYNSIGIECNIKPENFEIQNNYRQYSQIFNSYWKTKENFHYSNIYGDINSFSAFDSGNQYAGMINGERIRSTDAVIRTAWTTDKYLRLHAVNIGLTPSQKSGVV